MQCEQDDSPGLPPVFFEVIQQSSSSKWRISPQHWAGSTGAFWQSQKQFPWHGRGAFFSPQTPERLTHPGCSQPHTTPPLPAPGSPLPSLLFSPQLSLPSTKFLSFLRSPFTGSWLCSASFSILLRSHWPAFPKLWAGVPPVPAAPCSLQGILLLPTPCVFCTSERRQGLASGKGVSSRPVWVLLGSHGKPQGCRCKATFWLWFGGAQRGSCWTSSQWRARTVCQNQRMEEC